MNYKPNTMKIPSKLCALIILVGSVAPAFGAPNLNSLAKWKNVNLEGVDYSYPGSILDEVVAESSRYFLLRVDAGASCPSGLMILADKEKKTYREVNPGTCHEFVKPVISDTYLTFYLNKKVTALYPLGER